MVNNATRSLPRRYHTFNTTRRPKARLDDCFFFFFSSPSPPKALVRAFSGGYPNPSFTSARLVVRTIIGLNTAVFGASLYANSTNNRSLARWLSENFAISVRAYREGRTWTFLTAAFAHQDIAHFLFNMLSFNAFSSILLAVPGIGGLHIFSLCIGSAIVGNAAWVYHQMHSNPGVKGGILSNRRVGATAKGASGMVMGVGLAATCLMPKARMMLLFPPVPAPLWVLMAAYVGIDMFYLSDGSSIIGHSAHLGGAVYGAMYYFAYLRKFGGVWWMMRRALRL